MREIAYSLSIFLMTAGLVFTVGVVFNAQWVETALTVENIGRTRAALAGVHLLCSAVFVYLLYVIPDDRRILYGAFCLFLSTFAFLVFSSYLSFLSLFVSVDFGPFLALIAPVSDMKDSDSSAALLVTSVLLILTWRELKKTPPGQNA